MPRRKFPPKLPQGRSGASLAYVLALMLLLMPIGTSVLTAASVAAGEGRSRHILNQMMLDADSMHRAVLASFEDVSAIGGDITDNSDTLGGALFRKAYDPVSEDFLSTEDKLTLELVPEPAGPPGQRFLAVEIEAAPRIIVTEHEGASSAAAELSGTATVTVRVQRDGREHASAVRYRFSGGLLNGDGGGGWTIGAMPVWEVTDDWF